MSDLPAHLPRADDCARAQLYDAAALVEARWPGEYSAMCRDLRDCGDRIAEEEGKTDE